MAVPTREEAVKTDLEPSFIHDSANIKDFGTLPKEMQRNLVALMRKRRLERVSTTALRSTTRLTKTKAVHRELNAHAVAYQESHNAESVQSVNLANMSAPARRLVAETLQNLSARP